MTARLQTGLVWLLGGTMMVFGSFLGLELTRIVASVFMNVPWDFSPRILKFILFDGAVMFLALIVLAYLPRTPAI